MIDLAINYKDELQGKFRDIWFNDKYKYWNSCSYFSEFTIDASTWNRHQFVSIDSGADNEVIGYIGYEIDRDANYCWGLNIINFTDKTNLFALDLGHALKDIFEKFKFNKLRFTVIIGNPIEESYDKIIEKYGGRIIGVQREEVRLIDRKLYDEKLYEITLVEYLNSMKKRLK